MAYKIVRNPRGYYTLFVDGVFEGNYDTVTEAAEAYDEVVKTATAYDEALSAVAVVQE